ncbi:DUF6090 family protein [Aegicerativicinus sediminis]
MNRFFKNIRQTLLMENKNSKYLKYAVGEIVLVVIGILIALAINNWNEERKIELGQTQFLKSLKEDLSNDLIQLNKIIEYQTGKLKTVSTLQNELQTTKNFEKIETLFTQSQYASNDTFFANTGTYTTSISSGAIANLTPESLKIAITTLYERFYYRLTYNGEVYDDRTNEVSFKRGEFYNKIDKKLVNPEVLNSSGFANLITVLLHDNNTYVDLANQTQREILKVLELINRRLKE